MVCFLVSAAVLYLCMPKLLKRWGPIYADEMLTLNWQHTLEKTVFVIMTLFYPSCSLLSLSLWDCMSEPIQGHLHLYQDLRVKCDSPAYHAADIFNWFFVVLVVFGWPAFLVWRLRTVHLQGRMASAEVIDQMGFLYAQFKPDYYLWDVMETLRKLYLVRYYIPIDLLDIVCTTFL